MRKTLLVALLALPGTLLGKGMVVAPARVELRLSPGESRTVTLTVGNADSAIERFRLRIVPFDISDTGEVLYENLPEPSPSPRTWIELSPEEVEVGADLSGNVQVRVTAPAVARGTIAGAILVSLPPRGRAESGLGVTTEPRVLVPVYVTVAGTETPAAEVASFDVSRDPGGVFHFRAVLQNTGNTLLRPAGTWVLEQQSAAGPVEILVVPFSGDPVLPGKTRKFEGEGRGKVPPGDVAGSVFFEFGPGKSDYASKSAPVRSVPLGPARETEHAAAGTISETSRRPDGSAAVPVRISLARDGIRLDAGGPVKYRSQTVSDPPSLLLDLVGYRVVNPGPLEGRQFVRRLEVQEIEKKPLISRVTVSFRVPVDASVQEEKEGLLISLRPASAPSAAAAPAGVAPPAPAPSAGPSAAPVPLQRGYVVQVGIFAVVSNAETAKRVVQAMGYSVSEQTIQRDGRDLWVVMAGPFADRAAAIEASRKLGGVVRMAAPK